MTEKDEREREREERHIRNAQMWQNSNTWRIWVKGYKGSLYFTCNVLWVWSYFKINCLIKNYAYLGVLLLNISGMFFHLRQFDRRKRLSWLHVFVNEHCFSYFSLPFVSLPLVNCLWLFPLFLMGVPRSGPRFWTGSFTFQLPGILATDGVQSHLSWSSLLLLLNIPSTHRELCHPWTLLKVSPRPVAFFCTWNPQEAER